MVCQLAPYQLSALDAASWTVKRDLKAAKADCVGSNVAYFE
jgi:hypothetical protein